MKKRLIQKLSCAALATMMSVGLAPNFSMKAADTSTSGLSPEFIEQRENGTLSNGGLVTPTFKTNQDDTPEKTNSRFSALGVPSRYDLRSLNRVTPLRDQGQNGSCWTFAAYGSTESIIKSEEHIDTDFAEKNMRNLHGFDFAPDKGGNMLMSMAYLSRWDGPVAESDDPYDDYDFTSERKSKQRELKQAMILPTATTEAGMNTIKEAVMNYGAVQTAFYANTRYENPRTKDYYFYGNANSNHAVTIVGWDDNYSRNNFAVTPSRDGAWLVRNSWGQGWGTDGGYFHVSYEDSNFAKGFGNCVYFTQANNTSDNIYYHDKLGMTDDFGFLNETAWASNVFKATDKGQVINQVGLFLSSDNTEYEVYAVDNYKSTKDFANKKKIATGSSRYSGYKAIATEEFKVTPGANFAVIVKLKTPGYSRPIAIERPVSRYSSKATASLGQSFVSADGTTWSDLQTKASGSNVCVKAFTKNKTVADKEVKVTEVKLNKSEATLKIGETLKLEAQVAPENATNKNVTFTSLDEKVATVDAEGNVKAVAKGNTTVTVKTEDGEHTATCKVVVTEEAAPTPDPTPTGDLKVTVKAYRTEFYAGQTARVLVTAKDAEGNPLASATVKVTITRPDGKTIERVTSTNSYGEYTLNMYTKYAPTGTYTVKADVTANGATASQTGTFILK